MKYEIKRTETFIKTAQKFFKKHPQLINKFKNVILKLEENPFEKSLRTHRLKGDLKDKFGISLDYKFRITVAIEIIEKEVILLDIGSHDEVY